MNKSKQKAVTLMELLVYIGVFALFLNGIFFTFKQCKKLMDATVKQSLLAHQLQTVKQTLQRDIRAADSADESIGDFKGDEHTLILTFPNASKTLSQVVGKDSRGEPNDGVESEAETGHIVYRFNKGRLEKLVFVVDGPGLKQIGVKGFRTDFHDMQFLCDTAPGKSSIVTVRVLTKTKSKRPKPKRVLAFSTAMRNYKR